MLRHSLLAAFMLSVSAFAEVGADLRNAPNEVKAAVIHQALAASLLELNFSIPAPANLSHAAPSSTASGSKMLRREAVTKESQRGASTVSPEVGDKVAPSSHGVLEDKKALGTVENAAVLASHASARIHEKTGASDYRKVNATPYGHVIPWAEGHWQWDKVWKTMAFTPNAGMSQGRLDPPGGLQKSLGTSQDFVKAVEVKPGVHIDFTKNSVNSEKNLRDAEYFDGGRWSWGKPSKAWGKHPVPQYTGVEDQDVAPITKWYHSQWQNTTSHLKSAYEPDFFRDNSEFFGPFRMDYHTHTVWLDDWNLHVHSHSGQQGRGNLVVGPGQYVQHAMNSFVAGRFNNVRGQGAMVLGGEANIAKRDYALVAGGVGNVAAGVEAEVTGGYHNQAKGAKSTVIGGQHNMAEGAWSSITGGYANVADGSVSSITGGYSNRASSELSTVHGGMGNKALAPFSTVTGGEGGSAEKKYEVYKGVIPLSEEHLQAEMHQVKSREDAMANKHS